MNCAKCGNHNLPEALFCEASNCRASFSNTAPPIEPRSFPCRRIYILANIVFPGFAQILFGQPLKGIFMIILHLILGFLYPLGAFVWIGVSIVDSFMVASAVNNGNALGTWRFFPL